jgi:ubiquitin C-terminal hydrolase
MQYNLIGIICHIGNAESGHYISYIKIEENKWLEFNDSIVMTFNQNNIESECFGGIINSFMDDFEWDKSA